MRRESRSFSTSSPLASMRSSRLRRLRACLMWRSFTTMLAQSSKRLIDASMRAISFCWSAQVFLCCSRRSSFSVE